MVVNEGPIEGGESKDVDSTASPGPRGIGGWLILPAIGIVLYPIPPLAAVAELAEILGQLPSGTLLYGFIWVEVIVNVALAAFGVKVAFDFFRKKRQAPANYIALMVA